MTLLTVSKRLSLILSALAFIIGVTTVNRSFAYTIEAEILDPNAMIFPVGRMIPENLSTADDIDFQSIAAIFRMRVIDTDPDDPSILVLMIRLEVAGEQPIFTVCSEPFNIRTVFIERYKDRWLRNDELAHVPEFYIREGDDVSAERMLPYIEGGNMEENLYILTVLLADPNMTKDDWDTAQGGDNHGIRSATMRVRNPSQVQLVQPADNINIDSNPIFTWNFPRNPGVQFHLELVGGDARMNFNLSDAWEQVEDIGTEQDPSTALDFANETTTFLDTTFLAGEGARGEQTSYSYQGIGNERALNEGRTYFWRVTAVAPTMFSGEGVTIESVPYTFNYGVTEVSGDIQEPGDGTVIWDPDPTFRWSFSPLPHLRFLIEVVKDDFDTGELFAEINLDVGEEGGAQRSYHYGAGFNERALAQGLYFWKITAIFITPDGQEMSIASNIRSFTYTAEVLLTQPSDNAVIDYDIPRFSWEFPVIVNVERFLLEVFREGEEFEPFRSKVVSGFDRSTTLDEPLLPGYNYFWKVKAVLPDESELESAISNFSFPMPELIGLSPDDNGFVYTDVPLFSWIWSFPLPQEYRTEYSVVVAEAHETHVPLGSAILSDQTSWRYEGSPLEPDNTYRWSVDATVTLPSDNEQTDGFEAVFQYLVSPPSEALIPLISPDDEATVTRLNPTFIWGFPRYPDDWQVEFVLTITPTPEGEDAISTTVSGNRRTFTYDGPPLQPDSTYGWMVSAHVTGPEGDTDQFDSDTRIFTYGYMALEEVEEETPQSRLLASLRGVLPQELILAIAQALSGDIEIIAIRIDGETVDLDGLILFLQQENIEVVLVSPGQ